MADTEASSSARMPPYRRLRNRRGTHQDEDVSPTRLDSILTILLIIVNEALQKVVSHGLFYSLVLYLSRQYHLSVKEANDGIFVFSAAKDFLPILFGFVADSYVGRFTIIGFGSVYSILGTVLLWSTAFITKLRPPPCTGRSCRDPTTAQEIYICFAFSFICIGASCVSFSTAFGVDQFEPKGESKHKRALDRYFVYYYASSSFLVIMTMTATAYIIENFGWEKGFRLLMFLVVFFVILFFIRGPRYLKEEPRRDLFKSFAQVIVAAYRNRDLSLPLQNSRRRYLRKRNSKIAVPSNNLSFLNKACLIENRRRDLAPDGSAVNPWKLCTIEQVEELKALIKVLPLWCTGLMLWVNVSKPTLMLLQAGYMNRQISEKFEISRGTFVAISVIIMLMWVFLYSHVVLPLASRIKGQPVHIGVKVRMGIGLFFSWMAMVISAVVESIRREKAFREGDSNDMSAMWLLPQYCLIGLAKAFFVTGQLEFLYTELPRSMSSVAVAVSEPGITVASWLSDVVSKAVVGLTSKDGKEMVWTDIDEDPLHYYYWALAILSFINLLLFLGFSWAYGPCEGRKDNGDDE